MYGFDFLVRFIPKKSVAGGSGVRLCTRNALNSATITEKPISVNIVHARKVSLPMFSWSEISNLVLKIKYMKGVTQYSKNKLKKC